MRVLLPVSLAEPAPAIASMVAFVERIGGTLTVLHVSQADRSATMTIAQPTVGFPSGMPDYLDPAWIDRLHRAEEAAFATFCDAHLPATAERRLREGDPADVILEEVRNGAVDAVIMGHRHHGLFERLVTGSVAQAVLEGAPCPVIVVPVADGAARSD